MRYEVLIDPRDPGFKVRWWTYLGNASRDSAPSGRFNIDNRGQSKKLLVSDVNEVDYYVGGHSRATSLWLPNACLGPHPTPAGIVLVRDSERAIFRRKDVVGTPRGLLARFSDGALYERVVDGGAEDTPNLESPELCVEVRDRCNANAPPLPGGVLNPRNISFDSFDTGERGYPEELDGGIVDLHIDLPWQDWLRARLHASLFDRWKTREPTPISSLMFGTGDSLPARSRAFLVLDELEGLFDIGEGGAVAGWTPPASTDLPSLRKDPLIRSSLEAFGLNSPGSRQDKRLPGSPGHTEIRLREVRDIRDKDAVPGETKALDEVFRQVFGAESVPPALKLLADCLGEAQITECESDDAKHSTNGNRPDSETAVEKFSMMHLTPRSRLRFSMPATPEWIGDDEKTEWSKRRKQYLWNPASRRSAAERRRQRRMALWWLRLIQPDPEGLELKVPRAWKAWDAWWKRHYLVALFREPQGFEPEWEKPRPGGLGEAKLGRDLRLGGSAVRVAKPSPPWDGWPEVLEA